MLRRKIFLSVFFISFISVSLHAGKNDSISTIYKEGEFISFCQVEVNASDSISGLVVSKFVSQMCYDIDQLFEWGLKGLLLPNEKDEILVFHFKTTTYNKNTGVLRALGDVVVPNVTTLSNLYVDNKVTQKLFPDGHKEVSLKLSSANTFLNDMHGVFKFYPKKNKKIGYYTIETHVKFGWFFDIFITQKRYKQILEWRILKVMQNLKEESEKRQKQLNN